MGWSKTQAENYHQDVVAGGVVLSGEKKEK